MNEEIKKVTATIRGIESRVVSTGSQVFKLDTTAGKYEFWDKKQDGSNSKAYDQLQKFRFKAGDTVSINYIEKDSGKLNSYTGKNYMNYKVLSFDEQNHIPVIQVDSREVVQSLPDKDYQKQIDEINTQLADVVMDLDSLKILINTEPVDIDSLGK